MFNTPQEAQQKLAGTVVLLDDKPVWIIGFQENMKAEYRFLGQVFDGKRKEIDYKGWEFKNLGHRLGYLNFKYKGFDVATYSRRRAVRKSHSTQGLSDQNVYVDPSRSFAKEGILGLRYKFSQMENLGMEDTLLQKFPSLSSVRYKMAKEQDIFQMAFDHSLAVSRDGKGLFKLDYKGNEIGWSDDLERFTIQSEWRYLDELFIDEHRMKVRS